VSCSLIHIIGFSPGIITPIALCCKLSYETKLYSSVVVVVVVVVLCILRAGTSWSLWSFLANCMNAWCVVGDTGFDLITGVTTSPFIWYFSPGIMPLCCCCVSYAQLWEKLYSVVVVGLWILGLEFLHRLFGASQQTAWLHDAPFVATEVFNIGWQPFHFIWYSFQASHRHLVFELTYETSCIVWRLVWEFPDWAC